jgi:HEAT repeat protein
MTTPDGRVSRRADCDDVDVAAGDAPAARTIATDRFPSGPSPAEAEAARLVAAGFFKPDAPESSLLTAARAANPGVRVTALQTLAVQNTRAGSQAISEALDDPDPFVRGEALNLLLNLGGPPAEVVRRLSDLLTHDDPVVRSPAAMALGDQPGAEAQFQLKRALDNDDDAVRDIAAQMLQQKGQQKQAQGTTGGKTQPK